MIFLAVIYCYCDIRMSNSSVLPNANIIYYSPNAATAFEAWRDVGLHCLRSQNITAKSFWIISNGLNEVFESVERLNVYKFVSKLLDKPVWWRGASGPEGGHLVLLHRQISRPASHINSGGLGPIHMETFSCVFVLFIVLKGIENNQLITWNNTKTQECVSVCMGP